MRFTINTFFYALTAVLLLAIGGGVYWAYQVEKDKALVKTEAPVVVPAVDTTLVTKEFAQKLVKRCNAKLSVAREGILIGQIVRVTHERFKTEEDRQAFMMILCIESAYNQEAKSVVGAVGIAQIMPQYIEEFAKLCGYTGIDIKDLYDTEVNLTLGACLFNHLLQETGNTYLAAASYNAGMSSSSVKNLKGLKAAVPETANYVAKIAVLKGDLNVPDSSNSVSGSDK